MNTLDFILKKLAYDPNAPLPWQIPNVSRVDLVKWFRELDFKTGVEIGVADGEYAKIICEINPQMKLFGVDLYKPYSGYKDYTLKETFEGMRSHALHVMEPYTKRNRWELIEKESMEAAKQFSDNSIDLVYIDGNHSDPWVSQDINEWSKKVRSGGIVAGHDWMRNKNNTWNVKDAVQRYTKENNINPWFILGTDAVLPGMVREGSRSWMFVRP
jgi:hypothetical protein